MNRAYLVLSAAKACAVRVPCHSSDCLYGHVRRRVLELVNPLPDLIYPMRRTAGAFVVVVARYFLRHAMILRSPITHPAAEAPM